MDLLARVDHHITRLSIFLLAAALVLGVTNCAPIQHTLSIQSTLGGSVAVPGEGDFLYGTGKVVELEAEAEKGYRFVRWTGDVEMIADVNAASTTITMDSDYTVSPNFAKVPAQSPNWAVVGAIGGVVLVVGLLVFYLLRRRRA